MMHWTRLGSTCLPRLVPLCTPFVFIYCGNPPSLPCVAAQQEQRAALGTQYEVPEVSLNMYKTIVLHHIYKRQCIISVV